LHTNFFRYNIKRNDEIEFNKIAEEQMVKTKNHPEFKAGDTVTVTYRIVEGNKKDYKLIKG
jgi:large subunit ribosomal protein L19